LPARIDDLLVFDTAVSKTYLAKYLRDRATVLPSDFGGLGDGVADDRVAIQAAFDRAAADQKFAVIPPGTWNVSAGGLMPIQPPEILFAPIHDMLVAQMQRRQASPRFPQPARTTWASITLSLTSAVTIVCSMPGGGRQIDPDDLGLRSKQNKRPKSAWTLLVSVMACAGELPLDLPARAKKQKEVLAKALQAAFGIHEDPLPARRIDGAYKAAFVCRDERPVEERRRWLAEYSSKVRVR